MRRPLLTALALALLAAGRPWAQQPVLPMVTLARADTLRLPGSVDSNSPVIWDRMDGRREMYVLTSFNGRPTRAIGNGVTVLGAPAPVTIEPWPGGGVWMEAIVKDRDAWYGFYHNENAMPGCGREQTYARIGAARSDDFGATWTNLGIIFDLPRDTFTCETTNRYFVGGVGDMSVLVDHMYRDLFIYFSQYGRDPRQQGVAVARLAWADRDEPVGKLMVWRDGVWLPGSFRQDADGSWRWIYPAATPLAVPRRPWHDGDRAADAFWGPSIHWNTSVRQYVMLLNRASDESFGQDGIYVSFNSRLDTPQGWSSPVKILDGGSWYPQVVGVEPGRGTDTLAGRQARFYMSGRSDYTIEFSLPAVVR